MIQFYRGEDCCPERSGDLPQVTQQGWGLGFESVFTAIATAKSLQSCSTVRPHPWDSPGKNTGVGCHFLLQCMKVKSESEVTQSCLTLRDPMDCSLPGSSVHGIFQARVLEWGAIADSKVVAFKLWRKGNPHTLLKGL